MKSRSTKVLSLALAFLFLFGLLSGCGASGNEPGTATGSTAGGTQGGEALSPITFTALDYNGEKDWGKDDISKEITRLTGVTLQYIPVGNDADEKCNILLASGDIPDLTLQSLWGNIESKYVAAGAVLQLDELVDQNGPNIKSAYGTGLDLLRSHYDGKLYTLSDWYQPTFAGGPNGAFMMRKDILKEFEPEKAEGNGYFTFEEYISLLQKVKAKYPDLTPYLPCGENLQWWVMWPLRGFLGIYNYSVQGDDVKFYYRDPKFVEAYKFLNTIYRDGLTDPEWAVMKRDPFMEKCASGKVFSTSSAYWDLSDANSVLVKGGEDKQFFPYKVAGPGTDPAKLPVGGTPGLGWDSVMIGKNCKDPARLVKFLDFCASKEGHRLTYFGIEGTHYDLVDEKPVPKDNILASVSDGSWDDVSKAAGFGLWNWAIIDTRGDTQAEAFDIKDYIKRKSGPDSIEAMAYKTLGDTAYDQTIFNGIDPDSGTPEALIMQKCQDIFLQHSPLIINASDEQQFTTRYNKMIQDLDAAGASQVEKIFGEKFNKRKAIFNWK